MTIKKQFRKETRSITFTADQMISKEKLLEKFETLDPSYIIAGKETAPTTGWMHWQGYAQFNKKLTFQKITNVLKPIHIEIPSKSVLENINYCKKEGNYFEEGSPRGVSQVEKNKTKWTELLELAETNQLDKIKLCQPSALIVHRRSLMDIRDANLKAEHHPERKCIWIWGGSGVGKTRWVFDNFNENEIFTLSDRDGWDQYNQERVAFLDEADDSLATNWKQLLRWADRYPVRARRLYGTTPLNYEILVVTSMKDPKFIFSETPYKAIDRRFVIVEAQRYDCEIQDLIIKSDNPFPLYLRNYLFKYDIIF